MASDRTRELATKWRKEFEAKHRGTTLDEEKLATLLDDALAALLEAFERETRLTLLREMAAEECVACKDGAELFRDEESGEWAHERLGKPNFLCQAPEIIADWLWQAEQPAAQPTPEKERGK